MSESTKQLTTEEAFKDGTWCAPQTSMHIGRRRRACVAAGALGCCHGVVKLHWQPFARNHTHMMSASRTRGRRAGLGRCCESRAVWC
jgi:hypothetical protein